MTSRKEGHVITRIGVLMSRAKGVTEPQGYMRRGNSPKGEKRGCGTL